MATQKVNTNLLSALRRCVQSGSDRFSCDRTIGTALVRRRLAFEVGSHEYVITDAGKERARRRADCLGPSCNPIDPSLLEDLPTPAASPAPPRVFILDDDDYWFGVWRDTIVETIPTATIERFETAMDCWHSSFTPDLIVIDLSSVAPLPMSHTMYAPICNLLAKWPKVTVIIMSACGFTYGDYVRQDIAERMPDADVRVGTFFSQEECHFEKVLMKWCEQRGIEVQSGTAGDMNVIQAIDDGRRRDRGRPFILGLRTGSAVPPKREEAHLRCR